MSIIHCTVIDRLAAMDKLTFGTKYQSQYQGNKTQVKKKCLIFAHFNVILFEVFTNLQRVKSNKKHNETVETELTK